MFQNPHGTPRRSALDHVALPFLIQGEEIVSATRRAQELLDRFGLHDVADQQFRRLSGGEAQRLMLARAVASAPDMLLIDEPTAQLDLTTARSVNASILELKSPHTIVVIATHDHETRDSCSAHLDLSCFQPEVSDDET
jgi:putative ABC transport system ATP-binding protein/lipoprotein-releasing system ATP-binding protein